MEERQRGSATKRSKLIEAKFILDKPLQAFKVEGPDGKPTKTMELSDAEVFELASTLDGGRITSRTKKFFGISREKGAIGESSLVWARRICGHRLTGD